MKKIVLLGTIICLSLIMVACGNSGKQKEPSEESKSANKYEYIYYEVLNDGDSDTPNVEIKYKDKKDKMHVERTSLDKVYEHILNDGNEKPYIVKDGKKVHIYRPPYMTYGEDEVEGEAVSKEKVTK
ncbi:hypothetical protein BUY43_07025 [Staphylococcus devriesei]|uniref:Lipoprotein n=1 Tax=Staphylococcus devriesei TaxID=586733 RepID=A0A2K4DL12_9STAP|nr:hypothetical protein [Staphylococcus devriesei]MCE5089312.1 hypothetical protein [Staphylococcus devriesei]MCE5096438.1 hypothetical protein [Staphylococcus devriesei]PNZ87510.1 hypothetical protein CD147_07575 [Staphylococcus devriesei]PTE73810.1 hypothetical protein BUY44_04395 [Staphylococcus devriesei]PTF02344.1 hypothetical protein BUY45_10325 [Staphylococcus devriesei]